MSTISTGIGLISGIDFYSMVDGLMAIQQRPLVQLQERLGVLMSRRTALLQISAQLLSIQNAASRFMEADFFHSARATSSNESAILATAGAGAAFGQYTFTVHNLASAHQVISAGFATQDATLVGAGTLTIEGADALLNRSTTLSTLNGGAGVRSGKIHITDRAGNAAEIDLRTASTIDDVVDAINAQTDASVTARVEGDHLVLEDQTGLTTGDLVVSEVGTGQTAADLGLLVDHLNGTIVGGELVTLSSDTRLEGLNDDNGVRVRKALKDFRITLADGTALEYDLSDRLSIEYRDNGDGTFTDLSTPLSVLNRGAGVSLGMIRVTNRAGDEAEIDLSSAQTIRDITTAAEWAELDISVTLSGSHLVVTDESGGDGSLVIEDVDGTTASALGIAGSTDDSDLTGDDIFFIDTVGDAVRVINAHADNDDGGGGVKLLAAISTDGPGLILTDTTSGGQVLEVEALNDSLAAFDLGIVGAASGNTIESRRLLAGLNTVLLRSLNGGSGVSQIGSIQLTDRSGVVAPVDLSNAESLTDVLTAINTAPTAITASISASGLGIELLDTSGGAGPLVIEDLGGAATAADLNIAFNGAENAVESGNLQRQYVSATTRLTAFRNGSGVPAGKFTIIDSQGVSALVDLTQGDEVTLQDVIDEINSRGIGVVARINDTGDGLLLEDTAGGGGLLKVSEEGGTTAGALGILGTAAEGETFIDGTFETRITVAGGDTLNDVLNKVRDSGAQVNATIINDGTGDRPYRLSLTSSTSGRDGQIVVDVGTTGLSFDTLMEAHDATVLFGSPDADAPLVLTSSTNTLNDVIPGVRLDLIAPSSEPVTISITQNVDAIASDLSSFVTAFNAAISQIDELTRYDPETETRGLLTGDATARRVRQRLINMVNQTIDGLPSTMNRLSRAGVTLSKGSSLQFDEEAFREAFENNPDGVVELFTHEVTNTEGETVVTGFGGVIRDVIEQIIESDTGLIPIQEESILRTEDLLNDRIDQLEILLDRRRERLLAEFYAMETALSQLQAQQTALAGISMSSYGLESSF